MHGSDVPPRFVPVIEALHESLESLDTRADRAELVAVVMQEIARWTYDNVAADSRLRGRAGTAEHETTQSLAEATRHYWLDSMAGNVPGDRDAFGPRTG